MVKSKKLKIFRKRIDQAERLVSDPFPLLQHSVGSENNLEASYYNTPLPSPLLQSCLKLYHTNMHAYYSIHRTVEEETTDKQNEFTHRTARFTILRKKKNNDNNTLAATTPSLAGYLHYRFCCDDDEDPSEVVLYVYELQIAERGQGLGKLLLQTAERIAVTAGLSRIMLTVSKRNTDAMAFYRHMGLTIDATSPSQHGENNEDYEILSKSVGSASTSTP